MDDFLENVEKLLDAFPPGRKLGLVIPTFDTQFLYLFPVSGRAVKHRLSSLLELLWKIHQGQGAKAKKMESSLFKAIATLQRAWQ